MSNASIRIEQLMLPTYPEPGKEEMPLFSEHRVHQRSTGRPYPNKVTLEVNRERKIERSYTVVHLENEYLDVLVLPEIGGRIFAARDKVTDYDFFYRQHVIKPGLIGALGGRLRGICRGGRGSPGLFTYPRNGTFVRRGTPRPGKRPHIFDFGEYYEKTDIFIFTGGGYGVQPCPVSFCSRGRSDFYCNFRQ